MNILSRLWNRFAESVAIRTYRRVYFAQRRDSLLQLTLHTSQSGVSPKNDDEQAEIIISLTTHGRRLSDAWLAIESVMQGTVLPHRIILWIDEKRKQEPLPILIQNQQRRGLEVCYTQDLGPYTKLIPALQEYPDATIVTIDDDILYPADMLEGLINASVRHPQAICANRVVEMTTDKKGNVAPLRSWLQTKNFDQACDNFFFEAVAGVLYPAHSLFAETTNRDLFMQLTPTADDIWFNAMARKQQTPIVAVNEHNELPYLWVNESMQSDALHIQNNNPQKPLNDLQFQSVWSYFGLS